MNNLALVLDSQGKYEEAEQIYRQTLALKEREVLGAQSRGAAQTSLNYLDTQIYIITPQKQFKSSLLY